MVDMKPSRPPLRYMGGKWKLAQWIISYFPTHRTYTEVFGGAASVLMQKDRCYAEVYNDLDAEVVAYFRILRSKARAKRLAEVLDLTPFARHEFAQAYARPRSDMEKARRLVIRSFMGFGPGGVFGDLTGFRNSSKRSGTTPARDWQNFPACMPALTERLRGVIIESRPATEVLLTHDEPDTLHYVDPPYVHETRSRVNVHCKKGYRYEMSDQDHEELASVLHGLSGMVALSGYRCPLYDRLFGSWTSVDRATFADGARARVETLWLNPALVSRLAMEQNQMAMDLEI